MKKIKTRMIMISMLFVTPIFTFAAFNNFDDFLKKMKDTWLPAIANIVMALAVIVFFWGLVKFIWQDKKEEGKLFIIWGIIALFIMITIWGIVNFMQDSTFGHVNTINGGNGVYIP